MASVLLAALLVSGTSLSNAFGGEAPDDDSDTGDYSGFVPTVVPDGMELQSVVQERDHGAPLPEVAVFQNDDVTVRITTDPTGTGAWIAGRDPDGPASTSTTEYPVQESYCPSVPPSFDGSCPLPSDGPGPSGSDGSGAFGGSGGPDGSGGSVSTTAGPFDAGFYGGLDPVSRLAVLEGIVVTSVRATGAGIEAHDSRTTTFWFSHGDRLISVDVFGLGKAKAQALVERLRVDRGGTLGPAPADGLRLVAGAPSVGVDDLPAASTVSVRYARTGEPGDVDFSVTTAQLPHERRNLLAGTAGWSGRIERWDGRDVIVDDDGPDHDGTEAGEVVTATAAFVDPSGVLVVVQGPPGDLRPYVAGLDGLDRDGWERWIDESPRPHPGPRPVVSI
jgi:hypothetical protein